MPLKFIATRWAGKNQTRTGFAPGRPPIAERGHHGIEQRQRDSPFHSAQEGSAW